EPLMGVRLLHSLFPCPRAGGSETETPRGTAGQSPPGRSVHGEGWGKGRRHRRRARMTTPPHQPDILLIISDAHRYGDLSAAPTAEGLHTPHLDRLSRSGTTFTRGYVTAPICSPSRAGLIAGAHQARWGARWFDTSAFPPE